MPKSKPSLDLKQLREFRHKVAILKRKGLLEKELDARKAQITDKRLQREIKKYDRVIRGVEKVTKVSKAAAKKLRAEGATVKRVNNKNRVVTDRNFTVNAKTGNVSPRYGKLINPGRTTLATLEKDIRELENKLNTKRGDAMALQIFGNDTRTYQDADVMIQDLHQYEARNPALRANENAIKLLYIKGTQLEKRNELVSQKKQKITEGKKRRDAERRAQKRAAYAALREKQERQKSQQQRKLQSPLNQKSRASEKAR